MIAVKNSTIITSSLPILFSPDTLSYTMITSNSLSHTHAACPLCVIKGFCSILSTSAIGSISRGKGRELKGVKNCTLTHKCFLSGMNTHHFCMHIIGQNKLPGRTSSHTVERHSPLMWPEEKKNCDTH